MSMSKDLRQHVTKKFNIFYGYVEGYQGSVAIHYVIQRLISSQSLDPTYQNHHQQSRHGCAC